MKTKTLAFGNAADPVELTTTTATANKPNTIKAGDIIFIPSHYKTYGISLSEYDPHKTYNHTDNLAVLKIAARKIGLQTQIPSSVLTDKHLQMIREAPYFDPRFNTFLHNIRNHQEFVVATTPAQFRMVTLSGTNRVVELIALSSQSGLIKALGLGHLLKGVSSEPQTFTPSAP